MNNLIKSGILEGRVMLFLGAGASDGSTNREKNSPPMAAKLAEMIAAKCSWTYQNENLATVYAAARNILGPQLQNLLSEQFQFCTPSNAYKTLSKFPWQRIYTTNIDDCFENALKLSNQNVHFFTQKDHIQEKDPLFGSTQYVYLNGAVAHPSHGYIFSQEEYAAATTSTNYWYDEVANDFMNYTFVFIGTKLDEPALHHYIEKYKLKFSANAPRSYVLTPSATAIQRESLRSFGLEHIPATIDDFATWLNSEFPIPPSALELIERKYPGFSNFIDKVVKTKDDNIAILLSQLIPVSRQMPLPKPTQSTSGTIKNFYKGFKPTWEEVIDGVPARLNQLNTILNELTDPHSGDQKIHVLVGPAGSGKTTMLMMAAVELSDAAGRVYFAPATIDKVLQLINEIERSARERYFLVIERIDLVKEDIKEAVRNMSYGIIVTAESQNIWYSRVEGYFHHDDVFVHKMEQIDETDAPLILEKIQKFGSWTRLAKMNPTARTKELVVKSRRQLLIGLMETTTGAGFEQIIERDYHKITDKNDKAFFVLSCIASLHRCHLTESIAARALANLGIVKHPRNLSKNLEGIVFRDVDKYIARHPIYARKMAESMIDTNLIMECIAALLNSFKVYEHPIAIHLSKNDALLFKSLFNHRFLEDILRSRKEYIYAVYSQFEKTFETDGLYWLQYGLSKRSLGDQLDALELLQIAHNAYPHAHTIHALAQQKMILIKNGLVPDEKADDLLADALKMLRSLDDLPGNDDAYPIVTLVEGHVECLLALKRNDNARVKAKEYHGMLTKRFAKNKEPRVKDTLDNLLALATTGNWSERQRN